MVHVHPPLAFGLFAEHCESIVLRQYFRDLSVLGGGKTYYRAKPYFD